MILNHGEVSVVISFDLGVCSYRVGKYYLLQLSLQLESCCFMEIP